MNGSVTRRRFIKAAVTIVGAAAIAPVIAYKSGPWELPNKYKGLSVSQYLTALYNQQAKGTGSRNAPKVIYSSRWLQEQYELELPLIQRFTYVQEIPGHQTLAFKACRYTWVDWLEGWEVRMI